MPCTTRKFASRKAAASRTRKVNAATLGSATLGCAATDETTMTLPWYFAQDIPVDPYAGKVVTGEGVLLHSTPTDNAPVLAQLTWDAVEMLPDQPGDSALAHVSWTDPDSAEVLEGYIPREVLRSIIDYRLIASRRNDRWRITALIAGD